MSFRIGSSQREKTMGDGLVRVIFSKNEARRPKSAQVNVNLGSVKITTLYKLDSDKKFSAAMTGSNEGEFFLGYRLETEGHKIVKSVSINSFHNQVGPMHHETFVKYFEEWAEFDVLTTTLASSLLYELHAVATHLIKNYFESLAFPSRYAPPEVYCWKKTLIETEDRVKAWSDTRPWELLNRAGSGSQA